VIPAEDSKHAAYFALEIDKLLDPVFSLFCLLETEATLSEKGLLYLDRAEEEALRVALSANSARNRPTDGFPAMLSSRLQRVLCVDDEPFSLGRRQAILEYKGCVVSTASSVGEAMEIFESRDFDVVITNRLVDQQTGIVMSKEMKRLKPYVPIIVLSSYPVSKGEIGTADAFMNKSELPESLLAKVEELVYRSRIMGAGDILPQKERLRYTRKSQLLAGIVESSSDAIFSKTLDGTILSWNKAAEVMYGYRSEEIAGKSVTLLQPPDRQGEMQGILLRLARGESVDSLETIAVAKGGHRLSVSLTISPILNHAGRIVGASTIARELSHSRLTVQGLGLAAARMAATFAHEIRNPLEASANALFLLAKSTCLDDAARQFLAIAQDELTDIRQISTATLDILREDSGCAPQLVKVSGLIDNVLTLYGRKLRALGIEVDIRYETDLAVDSFHGELRQVFSNIVVNAADALEKTGGKLCIHLVESFDWANPTQRGLRATISDTGPGIPAEERKQIFEPFYTTKGKKGAGVGLWLCLDIVQKYGGKIRVRSTTRPGRSGTTFCVFLPTTGLPPGIASIAA
jgi:PAS domain S-box-containing protein